MDAALIVGDLLLLLISVLILVAVLRINREVKTLKDQATLGILASEGETRRVEQIDRGERTTQEQRHLDSAALKEAPDQGGE